MAVRKKSRTRGGGWLPGALLGLVVVGALSLLAAAIVVRVVEAGLPAVPSFEEYRARTPKVSRVLAADGSVVAEFFVQRRTLTEPDRIPPTLERAYQICRAEGLEYVYLGNLPANRAESTFCPGCGAMVIERHGYQVRMVGLSGNRCSACKHVIPGRF